MAHFIYPPGTPLGTVPFGYVVPSTEWQLVIRQVFKSINGDEGGTWAPSSFIVVGGSGFSLTGTGHHLAASARFTVQSTAEIRVANGGLVKLDGTGGDILMKVVGGVATIEAETGTLTQYNAGAAVDVYGSVTWKTAGSATWNTGTTGNFASGSTLNLNSGSITNANGSFRDYGTITIKSTGDVTFEAGSQMTAVAGVTWAMGGALAVTGELTIIGSSNWVYLSPDRTWHRPAKLLIPMTFSAGSTTWSSSPDAWLDKSDLSDAPTVHTKPNDAAGCNSLLEFTELPIGGHITSVTITTKGTVPGSISSTLPRYQIVSWEDTAAAGLTTHSALTVDDAVIPTFPALVTQTTIAVSGTTVVTAGKHYGLKITHTYEPINNQGCRIYECTAHGTTDVIEV